MTISIRSKAILLFIGLALAPLILTTWIIIRPTVLAAIQQARIQNLEGIGDRQAELITVWMHERLHDAAVTAAMLSMHPSELTDQFNHTKLLYYLDTVRKEYGYKTIFVCDKDGRIWLSSGGDLKGQDVSGSDYFQQALKGSTFITEVRPSEFPIENELGEKEPGVPTLLVSTPVKAKGEVAGVLVLRVDLMLLNKEVRRVKMGKTGETYLVNSDGYMLTESAFIPAIKAMGLIKKRSALELRLKDPQTGKLTKGVKHCLEGGSGFNPEGYADYRGVQVLGYWHWMPEFRWGLMSEIDVVEAYEVIYRLDHYLLLVLGASSVAVAGVAFFTGTKLARPVLHLTEAARNIAKGDLTKMVTIDSQDELGELASAFNIMTQALRRSKEALERLAIIDELSGLFNRRHLNGKLKEEVMRVSRHHHPLSILFMDIDRFKEYNDVYSHPEGDIVIKTLGQIILSHLREKVDTGYRYGGEEFVVILPETTTEQALIVAKRISRAFSSHEFRPGGKPVFKTLSIGVTGSKAGTDNCEKFLARADKAMLMAKSQGRNRICLL